MNDFIKNYEKRKNHLLEMFDKIASSDFVPYSNGEGVVDQSLLNIYRQQLEDNTFIVSVCGQIKAGKSTFLNYLLFKDQQILPAAATPWTAKLTRISYADETYARIHFYSRKEWEYLRKLTILGEGGEQIDYFARYLQEPVERAAREEGIYAKSLISDSPQPVILRDLATLRQYITAKGVYTPFVADVEIFLPEPQLKNVVIVDTPGINDANEARSRVTTDFINQSSAVVYLFYSTKPLDTADFKFIDRHLAGIASSKIIFASGKCDQVSDIESVTAYIDDNLRNHPELTARHFLNNGKVYPFSTAAAILNYKQLENLTLSADEKYLKRTMSSSLISNNGLINELIDAIGSQLMNDKGADVLEAAGKRILTVCQGKIGKLQAELAAKKQTLNDASLSADEIHQKLSKVKEITQNIEGLIADSISFKTDLAQRIENEIAKKKNLIRQNTQTEFDTWLYATQVKKALKFAPYELKQLLHNNTEDAIDLQFAKLYFDAINEHLSSVKSIIQEKTKELFKENKWKVIFRPAIPIAKLIEKALKRLNETTSRFENCRVRLWRVFPDDNATRANISAIAAETIESILDHFSETLSSQLSTEIDSYFIELKSEVVQRLNTYETSLSDLEENYNSWSSNTEKLQQELSGLEKQLAEHEAAFEPIKIRVDIALKTD